MIHSSLTPVHFFHNGYVGKQPVAWEKYCAENWLKELLESMDRCIGRPDITEILLNQSIEEQDKECFLERVVNTEPGVSWSSLASHQTLLIVFRVRC